MKTATNGGNAVACNTVRIWDPLVRLFHWSLVLSFFGAYLLGEDGAAWHQNLGYAALGLIAFRITWGLIGTHHARFSNFVPSAQRLRDYLRDVIAHKDRRFLGHNPAGALMILALLAAVIATGATGWMMTTTAYWGVEWVEQVHEAMANSTLVLVGLHLAGVVFTSIRHRENLARAMITGSKRAD